MTEEEKDALRDAFNLIAVFHLQNSRGSISRCSGTPGTEGDQMPVCVYIVSDPDLIKEMDVLADAHDSGIRVRLPKPRIQ